MLFHDLKRRIIMPLILINLFTTRKRIADNTKFKKSKAAFLYGMALEKKGDIEKAEAYLKTFDAPYSRYMERLELAKFYIRIGKLAEAKGGAF